jgi:rod shape-determining protein MreC
LAVYRRSARPRFTLVLLVLSSLTVITLDYRGDAGGVIDSAKGAARDAFAPVESAGESVVDPVGDFFQGIFNYGDLEAENARLRQQLDEVQGDQVRAADAERERKALLDLQNLDFIGDIPTVAARVVSTSSNFELVVQIDKGRSQGVARGMPVVTGAGLVGRVVEVSRNRATVLLVTDLTSRVGVRLTGSGDVGVAAGKGRRTPLDVDLIGAETDVDRRELVVTSGLQQSVFPPSIPVGRVVSATAEPGALRKEVKVEPLVDLRRLTFVKVLLWSPS